MSGLNMTTLNIRPIQKYGDHKTLRHQEQNMVLYYDIDYAFFFTAVDWLWRSVEKRPDHVVTYGIN